MRVAYLGPQGSFSEEAAFQYFSTDYIEWYLCESIVEVLEAVSERKADKGFVPIENSIEGMINITADGLLRNKLFIEAEVIFPVTMNLLAVEERTSLDEIREVWSINPVLAQCHEFIRRFKLKSRQFDSSSLAALAVKEHGKREVAAIASESAATLCHLHIIKRNIQDHSENHTRFFVVNKNDNTFKQQEQKNNKTLLLTSPDEDHSGVLSSILNVFAALSINLTWIQSRPTKKKLGTYHFFIEVESGLHETKTRKAMNIIKAFDYDVHVLGSYHTTHL